MRIYLNDRVVHLARTKPEEPGYHQVATRKEVELLYISFEADPSHKELVLFSEDYDQMKADFMSQFRVVEAAGGFVRNERNEILFIFRRGHWDLPKGKIDNRNGGKEKRKAAALREVAEETGVFIADVVSKKGRTFHIFFEKRERYLKKTWWYEMRAPADQPLVPQTEEDITEVAWIPQERLKEVLAGAYPSLLKLFR